MLPGISSGMLSLSYAGVAPLRCQNAPARRSTKLCGMWPISRPGPTPRWSASTCRAASWTATWLNVAYSSIARWNRSYCRPSGWSAGTNRRPVPSSAGASRWTISSRMRRSNQRAPAAPSPREPKWAMTYSAPSSPTCTSTKWLPPPIVRSCCRRLAVASSSRSERNVSSSSVDATSSSVGEDATQVRWVRRRPRTTAHSSSNGIGGGGGRSGRRTSTVSTCCRSSRIARRAGLSQASSPGFSSRDSDTEQAGSGPTVSG